MENNSEKCVLTVEEVRRRLGISRGLMYEAIHRRQIPSIKIGRRIVIPEAAFDLFLQCRNECGQNSNGR